MYGTPTLQPHRPLDTLGQGSVCCFYLPTTSLLLLLPTPKQKPRDACCGSQALLEHGIRRHRKYRCDNKAPTHFSSCLLCLFSLLLLLFLLIRSSLHLSPYLLSFFILPTVTHCLAGLHRVRCSLLQTEVINQVVRNLAPGTICRGLKVGPDLLRGA